jgi:hypothetical protein
MSAIGEPEAAVRPLPFFYDLYTFRGDAGATDVVASFAVPVGRLQKENWDDQVRYRFDVTLVLSDTVLQAVYRADDSVYVSLPYALEGDHLLHTQVEVQAPPSVTTVHRVVMTDATTPGVGTLALFPTSQFPEGAFDVFYEVYNLPSGNRYVTEVSIEPLGNRSGRAREDRSTVHTRFSGESAPGPDGALAELRRVEASLPEGRYRLTVTVTDRDSGQTASRSRLFQIQGWRGATMVPALPRRVGAS